EQKDDSDEEGDEEGAADDIDLELERAEEGGGPVHHQGNEEEERAAAFAEGARLAAIEDAELGEAQVLPEFGNQDQGEDIREGCIPDGNILPCEPPNRTLSPKDELRALLFDFTNKHPIGPKAFDHLRRIFTHVGIDHEIESLAKLEGWATKKSGINVVWTPQCPDRHVSFGGEHSEDLECPYVDCRKAKFFPPGTSRQPRKSGQPLTELDEQPRSQHAMLDAEPYIEALLAHPVYGVAMHANAKAARVAALTDSPIVSGIETGMLFRRLYGPGGCLSLFDVPISETSDGAVIYPHRNPTEQVYAHFAGSRVLTLPVSIGFRHKWIWMHHINGPDKARDEMSYMSPIITSLARLEKRKWRYSAAAKGLVFCRVVNPLNHADTVEQKSLGGTVGASGKAVSFVSDYKGIRNYESPGYVHPIFTLHHDPRPDIRLPTSPPPPLVGHDPLITINLRTWNSYTSILKDLVNARTKAIRDNIQLESGITGPSIFGEQCEWAKMDEALMRSRHLKPSFHGPNVRSLAKFLNYKCAERKSFFFFYFVPLFHGIYRARDDMELVVAAVRATRLHQATHIHRTAPFIPNFRTYSFDDDGLMITPFANMKHANLDWITRRELHLVNRSPMFAALCTPSIVRSIHLPEMAVVWGGSMVTSQWGFEGSIGDSKRLIQSREHPVPNMMNNKTKAATSLLIEIKYDIPDLSMPVPNATLRLSHPSLPGTTLLHKKEAQARMDEAEEKDFRNWLGAHRVNLDRDALPTKWGRCELANGELLRSLWVESGLEIERVVVEDDEEEDGEDIKEGNGRARRFAKCVKTYNTSGGPLIIWAHTPKLRSLRTHI
ncbi:hypothetical protein P7C70_g7784, partial [Phenoliferia sp. Uapishka_3]